MLISLEASMVILLSVSWRTHTILETNSFVNITQKWGLWNAGSGNRWNQIYRVWHTSHILLSGVTINTKLEIFLFLFLGLLTFNPLFFVVEFGEVNQDHVSKCLSVHIWNISTLKLFAIMLNSYTQYVNSIML